jgi:hypothetical protein
MPSPTIERHRRIANGAGGDIRLAAETVAEIVTSREALFRVAPSHQGGHSATGKAIADALGCTFPLQVYELEAKAKDEGMDPDVLWPWLKEMRTPQALSAER